MKYIKYDGRNIEPLIELDKEAVEDFYDLIKDVYNRDDFYDIDKYYADGEFYLLLDDDDKVIGTCAYHIRDNNTVELKRLRIKKDLRGKGLGKGFIKFMEDRIKSKGFNIIVLNTSIVRENTLKFYEKVGFIRTGREPFGKIEIVYFIKELV